MQNVTKGGGQIRLPEGVKAVDVAAGGQFTAVACEDGSLLCSGNNDAGQLGMGDTTMRRKLELVSGVGPTVKFRKVSCGLNHTCALAVSGEAYTFGWGGNGRLGHGDANKRMSPCLVEGLKDNLFFSMEVACGGASTSVLSDQGDVWSWGWNCYGQCGVGDVEGETVLATATSEASRKGGVVCAFSPTSFSSFGRLRARFGLLGRSRSVPL